MTITLSHKLPIINGYVEIPDAGGNLPRVTPDEVIAEIPDAVIQELPFNHFQSRQHHKVLVLPSFNVGDGPDDDYYEVIRNIARAKLA